MINDRDLKILGAGAVLALVCLFLPVAFALKIALGFLILIVFMALAFLRFGGDRVPLETWLTRRARYGMKPHLHVWGGGRKAAEKPAVQQPAYAEMETEPEEEEDYVAPDAETHKPEPVALAPIGFDWAEAGAHQSVRILMFVIGAYFIYWIVTGGANEIAVIFGG